jgi:hypothetical protein
MYSSIQDLSLAGIAILNSTSLPPAVTRRWLKPVSHTSNLRNAVGRPWIIYSATADEPINPRIEVFTNYAFLGQYSSYMVAVPDLNFGYAVLAVDSSESGKAADLNAHADFLGEMMIPALEKAAIVQAGRNFAGGYSTPNTTSEQAGTMVIDAPDGLAGLSIANLTRNGENIRAQIAESLGVTNERLSFRIFPSNVKTKAADGWTRMAFRAVFQDTGALVDGGTPTCISWEMLDGLRVDGKALDRLVFTIDGEGKAVGVEYPAWGLELERAAGSD